MSTDQFATADRLEDEGRYAEAFQLFQGLAEQGDTAAMTRLALMYASGRGVEHSLEQSIAWDMRAAALGEHVACFNLGISYRDAGDLGMARNWFEQAVAAGDGEAALELAKTYLAEPREPSLALTYLKIARQAPTACADTREEAERLLSDLQ